MSERILEGAGRVRLDVGKTITLNMVSSEESTQTFEIIEMIGCGGTAIAYKVSYSGADNNRYLYVLKELYPVPAEGTKAINREGASLDIDSYDKIACPSQKYSVYRKQFEATYRVQNRMATGKDAVTCMTTSLPIGLYEDRLSSKDGNYAVYGLFQYQIGHTLKEHTESSLTELIDIQRKIAEVVKAYHNNGYLWFDIKESNVNVVGAGTVQSVSMFDFGSLVLKEKIESYQAGRNQEFSLSFSPTSSSLLLPRELESILSANRTNAFVFVDVKKNEKKIQALGKYGEQTDIFLLGSLLFKRLMGTAPTREDCQQIQDGSFDMNRMTRLYGYSKLIVAKIEAILKNCLNYENRNKRYQSVTAYMIHLNELYLALCTQEGLEIVKGNARGFVAYRCNQYLNTVLTGDTNGKFKYLKQLQGRFESRVSLRSDQSQKQVLPSVAIDNASPVKGSSNRLVFLYGDGGMGKSTALYDYMRETASATPIYIELSQYRFIDKDTSFVFTKIFEDICNKFIDVAGFIPKEELSRVEDILMESLKVPDANDPRPQYVLLLDGYNEISREEHGGFDVEIAKIIDTWKNCRIVITSRNLPTDYDGKEISTYEYFSRFEFIGISEEERASLIGTKYPERIEKIQRDKRLWDVLRIPMFMGMFIQFDNSLFNSGQTVSIHTRGEILDQFIMKTETDAAKLIADRQPGIANNSILRSFLVQYGLPIIANEMDQQHSFNIERIRIVTNANRAWTVYDDNNGLMVGCLLDINVPDKPSNLNKKIIDLLNVQAGYCYKTTDGTYSFTHQYFRDYFAAKHIQNILNAAKALGENGLSKEGQLQFTKDNGLDYTWSDDVCILLGEIIGDYKNEPGYSEE